MRARRLLVVIALGALACAGREPTRDVRVTIIDESGAPLPGAFFYAEAYDGDEVFAFLSARSGQAGEVPDSAREPLKIAWRPDAHIALAALAPGFAPAVLRDPTRRVESDGAVLQLRRGPPGPEQARALLSLGFPFPSDSPLRPLAARPENEAFCRALLDAFRALQGEGVVPASELEARIEALGRIL